MALHTAGTVLVAQRLFRWGIFWGEFSPPLEILKLHLPGALTCKPVELEVR